MDNYWLFAVHYYFMVHGLFCSRFKIVLLYAKDFVFSTIQIFNKEYIKHYIVYVMLIYVLIFQKYIAFNDYVAITLVLILVIDKIWAALVITVSLQL